MRCLSERGFTARRAADRGSVSAEFALALPAVILVLLVVLSLGLHGGVQVTLEEGARVAARELARGEPAAAAESAALRVAGEGVSFQLIQDDSYVTVVLERPVRMMGVIEISATQEARATARVELAR